MSYYNKYIFGDHLNENNIFDAGDIYADATWARPINPMGITIPRATITGNSYVLSPNSVNAYTPTSSLIGLYNHSFTAGVVSSYYQLTQVTELGMPSLLNIGQPNVGIANPTLNGSLIQVGGSYYTGKLDINGSAETSVYGTSYSVIDRNKPLYGGVLDLHALQTSVIPIIDGLIRPVAFHTYDNNSPCLGIGSGLGHSDYIGKQTKSLYELHDQLSELTKEAKWLESKITDEFYQSLYLPYGEDIDSYIKSWSERVKQKIEVVQTKFDRLFKYILKVKISVGTIRRINKKRVFRTQVNLVFKNLDDAHSAELNYFNSVKEIYLTFKYNKSWNLTYNN